MRILSNEYTANLPESLKKAQGGPARFASNLSQFISKNKHEWIGVLGSTINIPEGYKEIKTSLDGRYFELHVPKINFENIREISETVVLDSNFKEEIKLTSNLLQKIKPDILFLNGFSTFCWLLYAAAKKCGIPVIIQHAGIMKIEVEQYKDLYSEAGAKLCFEMERDVTVGASVNIVLNTYSENVLAKTHDLVSIPNSVVIPLPHPEWVFKTNIKARTPSNLTLGVVARWDRIKNHEALLALAEEISTQSLPWKIRVVTTIPETEKYKEMKARYRELIEVVPPMNQEELREFYSKLDIALLPSHFDVSPNVVMEALTTNTPTLISPTVGWVSEYNENGMQQWVISFSDPKKVIERIHELLNKNDWSEVEKLAKFIKVCHNPETIYKKYLDLFEENKA